MRSEVCEYLINLITRQSVRQMTSKILSVVHKYFEYETTWGTISPELESSYRRGIYKLIVPILQNFHRNIEIRFIFMLLKINLKKY